DKAIPHIREILKSHHRSVGFHLFLAGVWLQRGGDNAIGRLRRPVEGDDGLTVLDSHARWRRNGALPRLFPCELLSPPQEGPHQEGGDAGHGGDHQYGLQPVSQSHGFFFSSARGFVLGDTENDPSGSRGRCMASSRRRNDCWALTRASKRDSALASSSSWALS